MPQVTPLWLLKYLPNMPASHVAIYNDLRGPNNSITLREASANAAVGEAFRTIVRGSADVMVAGATGTRVHPMKMVHSLTQEEVAGNGVDPTKASRPFDLNRSGMVLGEGAGAIVLEELEYAQARGATIYGEVIGTASSSVSDARGIARRETALANVMTAALRDAEVRTGRRRPPARPRIEHAQLRRRRGPRHPARVRRAGPAAAGHGGQELFRQPGRRQRTGRADRQRVGPRTRPACFQVLNYDTPDPDCPLQVATADTPAGVELPERQRHAAGPGQRRRGPQAARLIRRRWCELSASATVQTQAGRRVAIGLPFDCGRPDFLTCQRNLWPAARFHCMESHSGLRRLAAHASRWGESPSHWTVLPESDAASVWPRPSS